MTTIRKKKVNLLMMSDDDGDKALLELTATLEFLFCHGNDIPKPLLERLRLAVKTTFFPNMNGTQDVTPNHVADNIDAVYDIVREIMDNDTFANALGS